MYNLVKDNSEINPVSKLTKSRIGRNRKNGAYPGVGSNGVLTLGGGSNGVLTLGGGQMGCLPWGSNSSQGRPSRRWSSTNSSCPPSVAAKMSRPFFSLVLNHRSKPETASVTFKKTRSQIYISACTAVYHLYIISLHFSIFFCCCTQSLELGP